MIKQIIKMWNDGVERGFTVFQWFLVVFMIVGIIMDNKILFLVCFLCCVLGFFEPVKKDDALVSQDAIKGEVE